MGVLARLGLGGPVTLRARAKMTGAADRVRIARVTRNAGTHAYMRPQSALLIDSDDAVSDAAAAGFAAVLVRRTGSRAEPALGSRVYLPEELHYLDDEDVIRIDPHTSRVEVIYRRWSEHNTILVTERCNSRCVMCSQPPIVRDDGFLVPELLEAIPLMSTATRELGITGGEPTLLFDGLIRLIQTARDALPQTQLHILSNGRLFAYTQYTAGIAETRHAGVVFGIPVFSDLPSEHDFVVQAKGAFDQTVRGLLNLARYGIRIEIRVVIHRATYRRLAELAQFIARNLAFAEHVALMGLETVGYARGNLDGLWIDPADYQPQLVAAARVLDRAGLNFSIYNHQLCLLDRELWPFAQRSISDWKNIYMPECNGCAVRHACGGFFAAARHKYSDRIQPIVADAADSQPFEAPGV